VQPIIYVISLFVSRRNRSVKTRLVTDDDDDDDNDAYDDDDVISSSNKNH
jgi:hypothetical protein